MMNSETKTQKDFFRIVTWGSALAFGFLVGSAVSVARGAGGLTFHFSLKTVLASLTGAALALGYWRIILNEQRRKTVVVLYSILMFAVGVFCFLYPIQFVAKENMRDTIEGLVMGLIALAIAGFAFWKTARAFDRS